MSKLVAPVDGALYIPIWKRPPNKFLYYKELRFTCGNYTGTKRIAVFLDRSGNEREEVAQVMWDSP